MEEKQQIFVSYDHRDKDYTKIIIEIMEELKLNSKVDFDLPFGANFFHYMDNNIKNCFISMVILSKNYISNTSWARREFEEIISRHIFGKMLIIPIYIDDITKEHIPFGLQTLYSIDNKNRDPNFLRTQLSTLKDQLSASSTLIRLARTNENNTENLNQNKENSPVSHQLERRIRVQVTNTCNRKPRCKNCHWDGFDKDIITEDIKRVSKIIDKICKERNTHNLSPLPTIEFTFTGGEPLGSPERLENVLSVCKQKCYVVTNGINIPQTIKLLKDSIISDIRISISSHKEDRETNTLFNNVKQVLDQTNIRIRFNYVIDFDNKSLQNVLKETKDVIRLIQNKCGNYFRDRITGVAFVEAFKADDFSFDKLSNSSHDIFKLAETFYNQNQHQYDIDHTVARKRKYINKNTKFAVEFVKVNCSVTGDFFKRCLECIYEKDVSIAADGRLRICSGWKPNSIEPRFTYVHFSTDRPLIGISASIRREYGTAGFFSHIPLLIQILSSDKVLTIKNIDNYTDYTDEEFLNDYKTILSNNDTTDCVNDNPLHDIATRLTSENNIFPLLYKEDSSQLPHHPNTIQLCALLLKYAYSTATQISKQDQNSKIYASHLIISLVILEYLSIDEFLFSTGRAVLIQGISTEILKEISKNTHSLSTPLYADSLFTIAAISMENIESSELIKMINNLSTHLCLTDTPQIQYIFGSLYRQLQQENLAIPCFNYCIELAKNGIRGTDRTSLLDWLYAELCAEAYRSLGTAYKSCQGMDENSRSAFMQADIDSLIYNTKLRYHSLFSDGYSSMRKYFSDTSKKQHFRYALRNFSDSISLMPTFYASLLRIGLLELRNHSLEQAKTNLYKARQCFFEKGLFSDQEYLNSLLCDLALGFADDNFDIGEIPNPETSGMDQCTRIGIRDVECVRDDAIILRAFADDNNSKQRIKSLCILTDSFIKSCNDIILKIKSTH